MSGFEAAEAEVRPPAVPVIGNVVGFVRRQSETMWHGLDELLRDNVARRHAMAAHEVFAGAVEGICRRHATTPGALRSPTRESYAWIRFLADAAAFDRHLSGLAAARAAARRRGLRPSVRLQATKSLWSAKRRADDVVITVHEGFIDAPAELWEALMAAASGRRDAVANRVVTHYAESTAFTAVIGALEALVTRPIAAAKGKHHDLDASFTRVHAKYFPDGIDKPRLGWTARPTTTLFGRYRAGGDSLVLSRSLDAADVPEWVIDAVMHHELLHKKLGTVHEGGRRRSHTPIFRALERTFELHAEADAFLESLSRRNRAADHGAGGE